MKVETKSSLPNVGKLLKEKRIKVDPETGDIISPKNPVEGTIKRRVTDPNTGRSEVVEIPRNAGHVKGPDGVWRIAMCRPKCTIGSVDLEASCPQEMYYKMCLLYEQRKIMGKGSDDFRPNLEKEEIVSFLEWKAEQKLITELEQKQLASLKSI